MTEESPAAGKDAPRPGGEWWIPFVLLLVLEPLTFFLSYRLLRAFEDVACIDNPPRDVFEHTCDPGAIAWAHAPNALLLIAVVAWAAFFARRPSSVSAAIVTVTIAAAALFLPVANFLGAGVDRAFDDILVRAVAWWLVLGAATFLSFLFVGLVRGSPWFWAQAVWLGLCVNVVLIIFGVWEAPAPAGDPIPVNVAGPAAIGIIFLAAIVWLVGAVLLLIAASMFAEYRRGLRDAQIR